MNGDKNGMYSSRGAMDAVLNDTVLSPFNELLGRSLVTEDREREVSENYRTLQTLGFVKGLCRACYDDLCMVERVRVPFREYMKEEDVQRYVVLLKECQYRLEELGDMLEMFDDSIREKLDVWKKGVE